jgi:hypothetical protein
MRNPFREWLRAMVDRATALAKARHIAGIGPGTKAMLRAQAIVFLRRGTVEAL